MTRFRPYPAYKDSGVEWLGKMPAGWEKKKVSHTSYVKGRIGWQGLKSDEFIDEGPYLVTGTDFESGLVRWASCYHVSEDRYRQDPYIQLRELDLLITKDGSIGKVAVVKELRGEASLNSGIFLVRPLRGAYKTTYMYWVLNSAVFGRFIDYTSTGTTIDHLYQNVFERFWFAVPSSAEQDAIAAFLNRETKRIDALVEKKEKLVELLQEKRTALISHAVTKGLDRKVRMRDSGVEWLSWTPWQWRILQLRRVVAKFVDYRGATPVKTTSGVSLVTAKNITGGRIDFAVSEEYIAPEDYAGWMVRGFPKLGDVLITTEAPLGEVALVDDEGIALAQRIIMLKLDAAHLLNEYVRYYFMSDVGQAELGSRATGSTAIGIKASHLREVLILVPTLPEQCAIVAHLDRETARIDAMAEKVKRSIGLLKEYRAALISAAVTGKIDVRKEGAEPNG